MPRLSPRSSLWVLRILWLATTVVTSLAIEDAFALTMWLLLSGVALVALVVCGPMSLTITRMIVPTSIPVTTAVLLFDRDLEAGSAVGIVAFVGALLTTLAAFTAETGEAMVQVSAYGDERRFLLRVPATMLPLIVGSWLLCYSAAFTSVVIFDNGNRLIAVALLALAATLTLLVGRRLYRFSCRWLVSVPAGVVVHDPVVLAETVMALRPNIAGAHLAFAGTQAVDLSGPAAGHAVEIGFQDAIPVVLAATPKSPKGTVIHATAVLIAPSRPGRALRALADRKISIE